MKYKQPLRSIIDQPTIKIKHPLQEKYYFKERGAKKDPFQYER